MGIILWLKRKKKGAAAAVVQHSVSHSDLPCLIVPNTQKALGQLAAFWRDQFYLPLIGVTGSNGKTTTKNMIAAILKKAVHDHGDHCLATTGNFNNEIGLPLNLMRLNEKHRYAVFEMGMNHFGEIAYLTKLARPNVAVITNAGASHLEFVKSLDGVARAKGEIFQGLCANGIAVLNADDAYYDYWQHLIKTQEIITFALNAKSNVTAEALKLGLAKTTFILKVFDNEVEIKLPLSGRHNILNALAAAAACFAAGIDLEFIKTGLESFQAEKGRLSERITKNGARVFDDTYNANPFSLAVAVNTLMPYSGRKIVVLGDMGELGEQGKSLHFNCGKEMKQKGVDYLLTFGELSAHAAKGFGEQAFHFDSKVNLLKKLETLMEKNANVLVKGSRSMHMEEIVEQII